MAAAERTAASALLGVQAQPRSHRIEAQRSSQGEAQAEASNDLVQSGSSERAPLSSAARLAPPQQPPPPAEPPSDDDEADAEQTQRPQTRAGEAAARDALSQLRRPAPAPAADRHEIFVASNVPFSQVSAAPPAASALSTVTNTAPAAATSENPLPSDSEYVARDWLENTSLSLDHAAYLVDDEGDTGGNASLASHEHQRWSAEHAEALHDSLTHELDSSSYITMATPASSPPQLPHQRHASAYGADARWADQERHMYAAPMPSHRTPPHHAHPHEDDFARHAEDERFRQYQHQQHMQQLPALPAARDARVQVPTGVLDELMQQQQQQLALQQQQQAQLQLQQQQLEILREQQLQHEEQALMQQEHQQRMQERRLREQHYSPESDAASVDLRAFRDDSRAHSRHSSRQSHPRRISDMDEALSHSEQYERAQAYSRDSSPLRRSEPPSPPPARRGSPPRRPSPPPSPPLPAQAHEGGVVTAAVPAKSHARKNRAFDAFAESPVPPAHAAASAAISRSPPSPPADVQALRTQIDRLITDAARQTARETSLSKELAAKERALESEREKNAALASKLRASEDSAHELQQSLVAAKAYLHTAEQRVATYVEQVARQKQALNEAHAAQETDKERQIKGMRVMQHLSRKLGALLHCSAEDVLASVEDPSHQVHRLYSQLANAQNSPHSHTAAVDAPVQPSQPARRHRNDSQLHFEDPPERDERSTKVRPAAVDNSQRPSAGYSAPPERSARPPERARPVSPPRSSRAQHECAEREAQEHIRGNLSARSQRDTSPQRPGSNRSRADANLRRSRDEDDFPVAQRAGTAAAAHGRHGSNTRQTSPRRSDYEQNHAREQYSSPLSRQQQDAHDEEAELDALIARELQQKRELERDLDPPSQPSRSADRSSAHHRRPSYTPEDDFHQRPSSHDDFRPHTAAARSGGLPRTPPRVSRSPPRHAADASNTPPLPSRALTSQRGRSPPRESRSSSSRPSQVPIARQQHEYGDDNQSWGGSNQRSSQPAPSDVRPSRTTPADGALRSSVHLVQPAQPARAPGSAPFATSVRSAPQLSVEAEVAEMESQLSDLLRQKELLETSLARASRPGATFDASMLPASSVAAAGGGARSRHAMLREGEAALAELSKSIHAHKAALRKLHAQIDGK